jgi:hypothetical protein
MENEYDVGVIFKITANDEEEAKRKFLDIMRKSDGYCLTVKVVDTVNSSRLILTMKN